MCRATSNVYAWTCRIEVHDVRSAGNGGVGAFNDTIIDGVDVVLLGFPVKQCLQFLQLGRISVCQILGKTEIFSNVIQIPLV